VSELYALLRAHRAEVESLVAEMGNDFDRAALRSDAELDGRIALTVQVTFPNAG
jgi:hypothetical protein